MSGIWDMLSEAFCREASADGYKAGGQGQNRPPPVAGNGMPVMRHASAPVENSPARPPPNPSRLTSSPSVRNENLMPNLLQDVGRSSTMGEWFGLGGYADQGGRERMGGSVDVRPATVYESAEEEKARTSRAWEVAQDTLRNQLEGRPPVRSQRRGSGSRSKPRPRAPTKDSVISKDSDVDGKDTTIGKGFSAKMRAGVKQAEKNAEESAKRTEMVPQKDGGFIATIQKGFEGLFGHLAASKEEVLRMRGPMPALEYEAVPGDDIDQKVQYLARWLPPKLGTELKIFRVSKGQYDIGDERVELKWHSWVRPDGVQCREVFVVRSSEADDGMGTFEPLPLYLQHSAGVAHNLNNGHAITHVPDHMRMSFPDAKGDSLMAADSDARFNAMAVAAEQAKLREQAALEWKSKKDDAVEGGEGRKGEDANAATALASEEGKAQLTQPSPAKSSPSVSSGNQGSLEQFASPERSRQPQIDLLQLTPQQLFASSAAPPLGFALAGPVSSAAPVRNGPSPAMTSFGARGIALAPAPGAQAPPVSYMPPRLPPQMPQLNMQPQPCQRGSQPGALYGAQSGTFYGSQGTFYGAQSGTVLGTGVPATPIMSVR
eukprot:TRINITY_DN4371_c0_g1_i1.p1 TRINITY_DN4371_c0_g1~~TRINITY_DN4371_c0_g1_i1.p1  ORF type:complete len:618 (-),score=73.90 TRINITY_DN4371_c0_g1_i1:277-2082(-)